MACNLLIGDSNKCESYINKYIKRESLRNYDIEYYNDKILIEHSRQILHSLSLKASTKKLIVINGIMTIEAQNALLKNIEELPSNFTLIICTSSLNNILPTIISRCFILNLGQDNQEKNENICTSIVKFLDKKIDGWELIDVIESSKITDDDIYALLKQLRFLLIDPLQNHKQLIYFYCSKLLSLSSLVEQNNVNKRIVLEKVFLQEL